MTKRAAPIRVVKVGGSLLSQPTLPAKIQEFLKSSPSFQHVFIVGGASPVDCVRNWQSIYPVTDDYCHWASLRMMSETARLLEQLCPSLSVIKSIDALPAKGNCIIDCQEFMVRHSGLARSWATTSDSIAAELAEHISADELWLLKSTLPESSSMNFWRESGFVDLGFCEAFKNIGAIFAANAAAPELLFLKGS